MPTTTKNEVQLSHAHLKTRLDTLRVKLHLGGMDGRDEFDALTHEVSKLARHAVSASKTAARDLVIRVEALEKKLKSQTV
jgi:predicted  nucleic acid-binding Zn-ribbon protein